MRELASSPVSSRLSGWPRVVATSALGGLLGGCTGAALIIAFTELLKGMLAVVSRQPTWLLIVAPLLGLGLSVLVLYGFGLTAETPASALPSQQGALPQRPRWASRWRTFSPGVVRSDITSDIVAYAGKEELLPWRLAPIRVLAIITTVGLGGPMGTEAPAAYLGLAQGAALADRGRWLRRLLRASSVAGGAAGVSALMGIPLVGTAYVLEMGYRSRANEAPLSAERVTAALVGSRRVADARRSRRRPDPAGRAEGAAAFAHAGGDHDFSSGRSPARSRRSPGGRSIEPRCGKPTPPSVS